MHLYDIPFIHVVLQCTASLIEDQKIFINENTDAHINYFFSVIIIKDHPQVYDLSIENWLCCHNSLTQLGQVTQTCVSILIIIVSDNGLSPGRCQAII